MPLNKQLTQLFKKVILDERLIDTGAMLRGTRVFVDVKRDKIYVNITTKFYLKYLYRPYQLVPKFTNNQYFKAEMQKFIYPLIEHAIEAELQGRPLSNFNPQVIIQVLGKTY